MFSLLDSQCACVGSSYDIFTEEYFEALYHIEYGDGKESHAFLDHGKQKSEPASEFKDVKTIQIPFEEEFEGYW
jgi:hypothetical protein